MVDDKLNLKKSIIFDFDGTMCRLFKNYDLKNTVTCLHDKVATYDIDFPLDQDAFDVFDVIMQKISNLEIRRKAFIDANAILANAEKEAVESGELICGVIPFLKQLYRKGILMGIATNNSALCVEHFLQIYCHEIPIPIIGRNAENPNWMKPHPWSVEQVLHKMNVLKEQVIFIGDTKRDYQCAQQVGLKFIGMAATSEKKAKLLRLSSDMCIVSDYNELSSILCDEKWI